MEKNRKSSAAGIAESQLAQTVRESASQMWLAGLGAVAITQEEGGKVFNALVKDGATIQARTRKLADRKVALATGKAADTLSRLEHIFEEGAGRALGSLGVPSKKDIDRLSRRIGELTAVVHQLESNKRSPSAHA